MQVTETALLLENDTNQENSKYQFINVGDERFIHGFPCLFNKESSTGRTGWKSLLHISASISWVGHMKRHEEDKRYE
uniref:Uncharacterized protein n=1 Tax=Solanum tuberosum TaxID=4113 RepID=M1BBN7_SOLTU